MAIQRWPDNAVYVNSRTGRDDSEGTKGHVPKRTMAAAIEAAGLDGVVVVQGDWLPIEAAMPVVGK